jgi:hypothetical protein
VSANDEARLRVSHNVGDLRFSQYSCWHGAIDGREGEKGKESLLMSQATILLKTKGRVFEEGRKLH